ncbi:MAG: PAS domain S-box protein [Desulfobacterium sp.]|nr:PAS domain S-box protein [Desulfobacterium sp.]
MLLNKIRHSLVFKLIMIMTFICLVAISVWAYFSINYQRNKEIEDILGVADRISKTIRLGTHYSMMLNARDDIHQIIQNTATQREIENVRIYNKQGFIKFSNIPSEIDTKAQPKSKGCIVCHIQDPPLVELTLHQRKRIFSDDSGERVLGIITPIYNEPACSEQCHFHDAASKVLGSMDLVISLKDTDAEIMKYERSIVFLALAIFVAPSFFIFIFVYRFVIGPIRQLTEETKHITCATKITRVDSHRDSEIGQLATAFNTMRQRINHHQKELTKQKNEYRNLFERVPCMITVQDKDFKLINFNREFYKRYRPKIGDFCYATYKGRTTKCRNCPVEKTLKDGKSYYSEEQGIGKNGTMEHWIVRTSPVKNAAGEIVAAMEINLDITQRKELEQRAELSEKKYHAIFNNIPNPVFVLDSDSLAILDCNESVTEVYGYGTDEIVGRSFTELFDPSEPTSGPASGPPHTIDALVKSATIINSAKHRKADNRSMFVDIWISPSEYPGQKVLLVTTSDITERLETENQFLQAAKLATLGEMATGVAHELNQPLSVIKTASSFCIEKVRKTQEIKPEILKTLLEKIDANVDRASKIINHMRDFARKSDINLIPVNVVNVLESAYEIFSQQLKVRGITVAWEITPPLAPVMTDPGRLEQVFINLLINARDAIEAKAEICHNDPDLEKKITIRACLAGEKVYVEVQDTGTGVPREVAEKIFQPFFTTKEVGKGTGLGLSISYGIIKECSGQIIIKETSDKGSVFQVILPAYRDRANSSQ